MPVIRAQETFKLDGHTFKAENCVEGILLNPSLPRRFDDTPNDQRPESQQKWWLRPYIVVHTVDELLGSTKKTAEEQIAERRAEWLAAWPCGERFTVRRLDGGAWDRSTNYGCFANLEDALSKARSLVGLSGYTEHMTGGDFVAFPLR